MSQAPPFSLGLVRFIILIRHLAVVEPQNRMRRGRASHITRWLCLSSLLFLAALFQPAAASPWSRPRAFRRYLHVAHPELSYGNRVSKRFYEDPSAARKNFHNNFCDNYYSKQIIGVEAYIRLCQEDEKFMHKPIDSQLSNSNMKGV